MFACLECGRKFKTDGAARRALDNGCPNCGGCDIDLARTTVRSVPATDAKMDCLIRGRRVIVSESWMNEIRNHPMANQIRTAWNRNRCGIHDALVAWIDDSARPADLECTPDFRALASL